MSVCFVCGVDDSDEVLFDLITSEGIVKICKNCSKNENSFSVKPFQEDKFKRRPTVYERLSRLSGYKKREENPEIEKQNVSLRKMADENVGKNFGKFRNDEDSKKNLIDNFHWIVMRARRMKHLTQKQLADEIHVPENIIRMMENGYVPDRDYVIDRIEKRLGINLKKTDMKKQLSEEFDFLDTENLTIADLQELKKKREERRFG
ncbi:MAG TPA: helix-turn-helix domain-containing protein [Candidatus Nanoarchaeia archaeon]|nr:helix-turn-helix domain-containing protein [Candidatus Nanoarchaeia archaeon]